MPVMLPPGQGVTVNLPAGAVAQPAPTSAAAPVAQPAPPPPPEPFRRVAGPDITLLPHGEEPRQPKAPATPKAGG